MIIFEEYKFKLLGLKGDIEKLKTAFKITSLEKDIIKYQKQSEDASFYEDSKNSTEILKSIKNIQNKLEKYNNIYNAWEDLIALCDIAISENDASMLSELTDGFSEIETTIKTLTLETLLTGEYDKSNAILSLHAGAGGTEAADWVEMLYRMYTRYATLKGFKYKILDYIAGDEAGIKSADILISGENAFGFLKSEMGVHRLVRISPFDSSGKRHTSFAAIEVIPEIQEDVNIEIRTEDLKIDTYRAGGAGGQHVNTTDSAVRITHLPSGVIVACQGERSQIQNKAAAMKMLKSKLIQIKIANHLDKIEDIKGVQKKIEWGSQIRSYVFMPYTLVKDHRSNFESGNITAVMDGELDGFIDAYLNL